MLLLIRNLRQSGLAPVIAIAFFGDTDIIRDDLAIRNKEDDLSSVKYAAVVAQASPLKKRSKSQTAPDCPVSVAKVAGVDEVVHDHKDLPLKKVEPVSLNKAYPPGRRTPSSSPHQKNTPAKKPVDNRVRKPSVIKETNAGYKKKTGTLIQAFQNAVDIPVPMETEMSSDGGTGLQGLEDGGLIDLVQEENQREEVRRARERNQIQDAIEKWFPDGDNQTKRADMQLATSFLQKINNSLCFFTVVVRMLSKVPWTARMATTHIRQDALVPIGKGWWVRAESFTGYPFARAELALAAAAYKGFLQPQMPEDLAQASFPMIDNLPVGFGCESMFYRAIASAPFVATRTFFLFLPSLLPTRGSLLTGLKRLASPLTKQ